MNDGKNPYLSCLYFSSNVLSRALIRMAEHAFRPLGLSPSYAFLLMSVNRNPGIQPMELSEEIQLTPSTVTRLIEKMETQGYLTRTSEGRATYVHPTPASLELDEEIRRCWKELQNGYRGMLGERYTEVLTEMTFTAAEKLENR